MDFEKYKNPMQCPKKPQCPRLTTPNPSSDEARDYASQKEQYDKEYAKYTEALKEYRRVDSELQNQFCTDAIRDVLGSDSTKYPRLTSVIFRKAYEDGHSGGFSEVYSCLLDYQAFFDALEKDLDEKKRTKS